MDNASEQRNYTTFWVGLASLTLEVVFIMAGRKRKTTHTSGLYRKRITLGRDENGKAIVKSVYGHSKEELEEKIAQLRIQKGIGLAVTDEKSTWRYWADVWKTLKYPSIGKSAQGVYNGALKHLAVLNPIKITKLTSIDLVQIVTKMAEDGLSRRTINLVIQTASQICRLARKNHAMMINIADDVSAPQNAPKTQREAISPDEERLLWNVKPIDVNNKLDKNRAERLPLARMFALMQLNCGLRREEAAALRWKNVDLDNLVLTVMEAYDFKGKRVKEPKTVSGIRQVPIPIKYASELTAWKEQNKNSITGRIYVFPGAKGILTEGEFIHLWECLLDAVNGISVAAKVSAGRMRKGVKPDVTRQYNFTSHQLRHTYATNAIAAGVDVRTVQYLMGHATPEMTMRYTHLSPSALESAREKLGAKVPKQKAEQAF